MEKKWKRAKMVTVSCLSVILLNCFGVQFSFAASSCVTCHTDEEMIVDNLAKIKVKSSALTSGAG